MLCCACTFEHTTTQKEQPPAAGSERGSKRGAAHTSASQRPTKKYASSLGSRVAAIKDAESVDDDSDGDDDDNASAASSAKRSTKSKKTSKKISLKDVMTISSDTEIADNDAALAYAKTTQTLLQDAITNVQKELHCAKGNKNVSKTIQELT